ncbi:hypothetical protein MJ581_16675 [Escherichia coli]|nr:hypothetical protein MJ581_16675 [Escherichia coli]
MALFIRNPLMRCFEAASHINMRMIAGKVMMDRNAPGLSARHCRKQLSPKQRTDRALAQKWSSVVCDYATLRPYLIS